MIGNEAPLHGKVAPGLVNWGQALHLQRRDQRPQQHKRIAGRTKKENKMEPISPTPLKSYGLGQISLQPFHTLLSKETKKKDEEDWGINNKLKLRQQMKNWKKRWEYKVRTIKTNSKYGKESGSNKILINIKQTWWKVLFQYRLVIWQKH